MGGEPRQHAPCGRVGAQPGEKHLVGVESVGDGVDQPSAAGGREAARVGKALDDWQRIAMPIGGERLEVPRGEAVISFAQPTAASRVGYGSRPPKMTPVAGCY